jgi:hypothetical protein
VAFNIRSAFQRIRNDHYKTEAEIQVDREEKQPDNVSVAKNLIISVSDRLLRADRTAPWPLTGGSDKIVHYGSDDDRPGYYMASKLPDTFIFLTFDDNGKGILVNKSEFYSPASTLVKVENIRDQRVLNDIVVRLKQIHTIPHKDFNTLPRKSWSWQVHP